MNKNVYSYYSLMNMCDKIVGLLKYILSRNIEDMTKKPTKIKLPTLL